jgi:hypothetical protein
MAARRKDAVISTDSHKCSEEADHPQGHNDDPCDDEWAISGSAEDLEVEERNGDFDEADCENARDDKGIVML